MSVWTRSLLEPTNNCVGSISYLFWHCLIVNLLSVTIPIQLLSTIYSKTLEKWEIYRAFCNLTALKNGGYVQSFNDCNSYAPARTTSTNNVTIVDQFFGFLGYHKKMPTTRIEWKFRLPALLSIWIWCSWWRPTALALWRTGAGVLALCNFHVVSLVVGGPVMPSSLRAMLLLAVQRFWDVEWLMERMSSVGNIHVINHYCHHIPASND